MLDPKSARIVRLPSTKISRICDPTYILLISSNEMSLLAEDRKKFEKDKFRINNKIIILN